MGEYYKLPASDNKDTFKTVEVVTERTLSYAKGKRDGLAYLGQVNYSYADWQTSGEKLLSVAKGKISMYPGNQRNAAVVATSPNSSDDDSDVPNDAFSTNYTRFWYLDF